ncbi:hypothetical protein GWI33_015199 [Rhynchophorus ferrugineus]|uniref:Uncharacterized protein n=1 Tax=Rhynchophorus ferrugineus TaxID=354439 RepID=A0A834M668_RHYFE|nr:hypothetical protein GWI33_015199 [Rhynchophorus ferrugineus]
MACSDLAFCERNLREMNGRIDRENNKQRYQLIKSADKKEHGATASRPRKQLPKLKSRAAIFREVLGREDSIKKER